MMNAVDECHGSVDDLFESCAPANISDANQSGDKNANVVKSDKALTVEISDAMSEREKVIFTVHTKTTLKQFKNKEFSVKRQHEEFIWLHDQLEETEEYAGVIFPPAPPKPDFDDSRDKLMKLSEAENNMPKEQFDKMKSELEAEYLATFKKTVAMHEVFLQRLAAHPILQLDVNFSIFLEYDQNLSVRGKSRKEKLTGFFKQVTATMDEALLRSNQKEEDTFFLNEKVYLVDYYMAVKEATSRADRMTRQHKAMSDSYIAVSAALEDAVQEHTGDAGLTSLFRDLSKIFEEVRKLENRIAADEDLKLSDTLRYYQNDSQAAKSLLYRRSRALGDYEAASKFVEKARLKGKDVAIAEAAQTQAYDKFKKISDSAKTQIMDFKQRRIAYFKKNLSELTKLQLKHARNHILVLKSALNTLKESSN